LKGKKLLTAFEEEKATFFSVESLLFLILTRSSDLRMPFLERLKFEVPDLKELTSSKKFFL